MDYGLCRCSKATPCVHKIRRGSVCPTLKCEKLSSIAVKTKTSNNSCLPLIYCWHLCKLACQIPKGSLGKLALCANHARSASPETLNQDGFGGVGLWSKEGNRMWFGVRLNLQHLLKFCSVDVLPEALRTLRRRNWRWELSSSCLTRINLSVFWIYAWKFMVACGFQ